MKQSQLGTGLYALGRPTVLYYPIDKAPLLPGLDQRRELFCEWCRHVSPAYFTTPWKQEEPSPREELTDDVHWKPVFPSRWRGWKRWVLLWMKHTPKQLTWISDGFDIVSAGTKRISMSTTEHAHCEGPISAYETQDSSLHWAFIYSFIYYRLFI